jgi:hypothetical protein
LLEGVGGYMLLGQTRLTRRITMASRSTGKQP